MQYHHLYHAGNFADVFKHCVLVMLLEHLRQKESPFLYLDTHAGIARYDLTSELAQKTREYERGVGNLWNQLHASDFLTVPIAIKTYCDIVCAANQEVGSQIRYYPGSPLIAHALLRGQDRMVLVELERECALMLRQEFCDDERVAVHHMNGYQSIKAFLPPKVVASTLGRGLTLIDPPFEVQNEYQQIVTALQIAAKRFARGIYFAWYPIKDILAVKNFYRALKKLPFANVLIAELDASISEAQSLSFQIQRSYERERTPLMRCGIAIINAPWQFDVQLKSVMEWLEKLQQKGTMQWLIMPKKQ